MSSSGESSSAVGNNIAQAIASTSKGSKTSKNAPENRSDVEWKYDILVKGDVRKIKWKFCEKIVTGEVYELKHHLAGISKDVRPSKAVLDEVKKEIWEIVVGLQEKLLEKKNFSSKKRCCNLKEKKGRQNLVRFL